MTHGRSLFMHRRGKAPARRCSVSTLQRFVQHLCTATRGKKALTLLQNTLKSRENALILLCFSALCLTKTRLFSGVRRSWLEDYLGDVWSHFAENFPIAVLYIFPITVLILLLLCCLTYVCALHTPRCSCSQELCLLGRSSAVPAVPAQGSRDEVLLGLLVFFRVSME